jgi:hypothetical protein
MSEDEARQILTGMDAHAIRKLVVDKRMDDFARVNAALTRLGVPAFTMADFQ